MNTIYIAWQDPETRMWHTVGRLTQSSKTGYRFCYTAGAEASPRFDYLSRMHDLYRVYPTFRTSKFHDRRLFAAKFSEW